MGKLTDYKVTEEYLKDFGLVSDGEEGGKEAATINLAWEHLLTRIFDMNDKIVKTKSALCTYLEDNTDGDSEDKIDGFKFAQYKVIEALLNSEANPITSEVDAVLSGRCGLIKRNGWQKN